MEEWTWPRLNIGGFPSLHFTLFTQKFKWNARVYNATYSSLGVCSKAWSALTTAPYKNSKQVLSSSWDGWPFGHNRHGPKIGCVSLLREASWIPMSHNVPWAEAYLRTKWHLDPYSRLATINMGRKLGSVSLFWGGAGSPSNALWLGPRPTYMRSAILIHPAIWPQ